MRLTGLRDECEEMPFLWLLKDIKMNNESI